jgi:hypothetical protein
MNNTDKNGGVQISFRVPGLLSVVWCVYLEVELLGITAILFLIFMNIYTVFHSGHAILHFYQQCTRIPVDPHILASTCYFIIFSSRHPIECKLVSDS